MTSSSGTATTTSSGSSLLQNSGSDVQLLMDQRKRKRMISNRESARRSRMRKQKHLDDLMAQLNQLKTENEHIMKSMNVTTQHYFNIESENSILGAQMAELSNRLHSLNQIICFLDASNNANQLDTVQEHSYNTVFAEPSCDNMFMNINNNPVNYIYSSQHPIMASTDVLQY